jgi:general transcription factor 3C polypeptide 5 (transcription factor C subunit 1)
VLRHKYFSLLDGYVASDAECEALLVPAEETGRVPVPLHLRKRRYGKHNMAKGALKPEDAAVSLQMLARTGCSCTSVGGETAGAD